MVKGCGLEASPCKPEKSTRKLTRILANKDRETCLVNIILAMD